MDVPGLRTVLVFRQHVRGCMCVVWCVGLLRFCNGCARARGPEWTHRVYTRLHSFSV